MNGELLFDTCKDFFMRISSQEAIHMFVMWDHFLENNRRGWKVSQKLRRVDQIVTPTVNHNALTVQIADWILW